LLKPSTSAVVEELGLHTSRETPKALIREMIAASDHAITLGCGEECPYVPGVRYVDWPVDDPKGQDDNTVRRIVADLDARVRELVADLAPEVDLPPSVLAS
jgi:arsenate reductase (thioredoxin)